MAGISIDFHAAPDELRQFIKQAVMEFGLHVVEIRFPPFDAVELDLVSLDEPWSYSSPYRELAFTVDPPVLPANGNLQLSDKNPDLLRLMIGGRSDKGLVESWFSAATADKAAMAVWKRIANHLKRITKTDVIGLNPRNGVSAPIRWHRYTDGAKALQSHGVPMLTINDIVLKFGQELEMAP